MKTITPIVVAAFLATVTPLKADRSDALPPIKKIDAQNVLDHTVPEWKSHKNALFAVRGFFNPGKNQRGVWDDLFILKLGDLLTVFNGNTDPSSYEPNPYFKKSPPTLQPGVYRYKLGTHKGPASKVGYRALVNDGPQTVKRDSGVVESDWFGIHVHRGSLNGDGIKFGGGTSSAGCLTLPAGPQYTKFIVALERASLPNGRISVVVTIAR